MASRTDPAVSTTSGPAPCDYHHEDPLEKGPAYTFGIKLEKPKGEGGEGPGIHYTLPEPERGAAFTMAAKPKDKKMCKADRTPAPGDNHHDLPPKGPAFTLAPRLPSVRDVSADDRPISYLKQESTTGGPAFSMASKPLPPSPPQRPELSGQSPVFSPDGPAFTFGKITGGPDPRQGMENIPPGYRGGVLGKLAGPAFTLRAKKPPKAAVPGAVVRQDIDHQMRPPAYTFGPDSRPHPPRTVEQRKLGDIVETILANARDKIKEEKRAQALATEEASKPSTLKKSGKHRLPPSGRKK